MRPVSRDTGPPAAQYVHGIERQDWDIGAQNLLRFFIQFDLFSMIDANLRARDNSVEFRVAVTGGIEGATGHKLAPKQKIRMRPGAHSLERGLPIRVEI